ncbi:MAG: thermonuclease family protein [Roseobacter sp.]
MGHFRILVLLIGLITAGPLLARDVAGSIRVIDGDTFVVSGQRIRLFGIDAPEQDQTCTSRTGSTWACGAWVTETARALYQGRDATCREMDVDRYGRTVARCRIEGRDVGRQMVRGGLAFAYRKYSLDYDQDEIDAAALDIGLHTSQVQRPSIYRQSQRVVASPPPEGCQIKGNISRSGVFIYHFPGQRDYDRTVIRTERGERWFCTADQARDAGWRAALR